MRQILASVFLRPYISRELPGWGRVYDVCVGDYKFDAAWKGAAPRLVKDKRNGFFRLVDPGKWADRSLYFLRRWYDLEAALLVEHLVKSGNTVLDVGANFGHFTMAAAAAVTKTGRVIAVEPNPAAYARLLVHINMNGLDQVRTVHAGLADEEGSLDLWVPTVNSGEASFAGAEYDDSTKVTCPILKGDDVVKGQKIDLIKIDVEGFESKVVRGLSRTIHSDRPVILAEVVQKHLSRAGSSRQELWTQMDEIGYVGFQLGLGGSSPRNTLRLSPYSEADRDGDVVWLPEEKQRLVEGLVT